MSSTPRPVWALSLPPAPRVVGAIEVRVVGDATLRGDRERGRVALRDTVARRRVAELGEAVVPDAQHPLADVARAGDSEVPRQIQVTATDPGALQGLEDVLEML